MSKVTFKSLEDMQKFSDDGAMLCDDICGKISTMLKRLREKRGLSEQAVSEATGIKAGNIELNERGRKKIKWGQVARLMKFYGIWVELKFISRPQEIKLDELLK